MTPYFGTTILRPLHGSVAAQRVEVKRLRHHILADRDCVRQVVETPVVGATRKYHFSSFFLQLS